MVRLIATDLDGTLLDDDHVSVPQRSLAALREASAQGISVAVASGRPWCFVQKLVDEMGCVDYALLCNGASVLDVRSRTWISQGGLEEPVWRAVLSLLRTGHFPFFVYSEGGAYLERSMVEAAQSQYFLTPQFQAEAEKVLTVADCLEDALAGRRVEKIDSFFIPPDVWAPLLEQLRAMGGLYLASGLRNNLEISSAEADKGRALAALCARRSIPPEEVMAFGDGGNDVEMLRWAFWSFAMENGMEEAKVAARHIAPPNHVGGLGEMVERYALSPHHTA